MNNQSEVVAARWVFPISSDPIQGGWVRTVGEQVVEMGRGVIPSGAVDLGDAVLLPRLINAHTHLEFSDLIQPIGSPGIPLHQWIGEVVGTRMQTSAESKQDAIVLGGEELSGAGTRLAGEITTPPCQYPNSKDQLELVTFAEVLGLDEDRADQRFEAAKVHCESAQLAGLSPHAPYSTTPEMIERCVALASRIQCPIAMHVAESPDERELLTSGRGAFANALQSMGVWREAIFPWGQEPLGDLIDRLARAPRSLLVHGNYLDDREIERISSHPNLTVVYCPRTHAFFQHDRHPLDRMLAAGVRVALGTDSRASNPDLNVWHEVQHVLNHRVDLSPVQVIAMATLQGAASLGRSDLGRIEVGARPGLGYVRSTAKRLADVYDDLSNGTYIPLDLAK